MNMNFALYAICNLWPKSSGIIYLDKQVVVRLFVASSSKQLLDMNAVAAGRVIRASDVLFKSLEKLAGKHRAELRDKSWNFYLPSVDEKRAAGALIHNYYKFSYVAYLR